ncbi:hypothetical protein EYF80_000294 [Liparis tanakae]|uniref:Uncharacterized protein n=1 Tax=Liparis tanakae TaxID=230148 RepID=A0A4Z2JID3_9TELE|nr:hypothetical protein EYF80_000294 [Liparis tanakae]
MPRKGYRRAESSTAERRRYQIPSVDASEPLSSPKSLMRLTSHLSPGNGRLPEKAAGDDTSFLRGDLIIKECTSHLWPNTNRHQRSAKNPVTRFKWEKMCKDDGKNRSNCSQEDSNPLRVSYFVLLLVSSTLELWINGSNYQRKGFYSGGEPGCWRNPDW